MHSLTYETVTILQRERWRQAEHDRLARSARRTRQPAVGRTRQPGAGRTLATVTRLADRRRRQPDSRLTPPDAA